MTALRKNIVSLFFLQGANYVLPLITIPYLVRVLGVEGFGKIAFAQAFIQYFNVLTSYSFNLSATRSVVLIRDDNNGLSRLFASIMSLKIALMLFCFVLMLLLVETIPVFDREWKLFCSVYLMVLGNTLFPVWFYQGLERMTHITVFSIVARLIVIAAIFLFVDSREDYVLAAAIWSSGMLLTALVSFIFIPRISDLKLRLPLISDMRRDLAEGWHIFVAMVGGSLYNNSNVFFLGLVSSPTVVGYFAAADKLIKAIQGIVIPVSQAVYPHVAALLVKSRSNALDFIGRLLRVLGVGMLAISVAVFLFAAPISELLFGPEFGESIPLIRLLAILPFIIGLNNVFGAQLLVQFDFGRLLSYSTMIPSSFHLLALYFVAESWGAKGLAVLMLFTETFVLGFRIVGLLRKNSDILMHVLFLRRSKKDFQLT